MDVDMRQRECLTVVLMSILVGGCHAARSGGSGDALRVSFTEAAKSADARTRPTNRVEFDRGRPPALPSRPSSGTRKQASTAPSTTPQTSHIPPCLIAAFPCSFDGVVQDN